MPIRDQPERLPDALRGMVERRLDGQLLIVEALGVDTDAAVGGAAPQEADDPSLADGPPPRLAGLRQAPPFDPDGGTPTAPGAPAQLPRSIPSPERGAPRLGPPLPGPLA